LVIPSLLAFALIAALIPTIFENVLAQQEEHDWTTTSK